MYGSSSNAAFDKIFVSLHIYNATLDQQDNVPSARWQETGSHVQKNQTPQGYLSDGFMLQDFPSMGQLDMGMGQNSPGTVVLQLKQPDQEVDTTVNARADDWFIFCIRLWKQVQTEKRLYVNNRTMAIWGRIMPGVTNSMCIGVEVHTVAEKINDGAKVTLSSADCMTNTRLPSHALGARLAHPLDPPCRTGQPAFEEWSSNLTSW